jgi:hypothetical protein
MIDGYFAVQASNNAWAATPMPRSFQCVSSMK